MAKPHTRYFMAAAQAAQGNEEEQESPRLDEVGGTPSSELRPRLHPMGDAVVEVRDPEKAENKPLEKKRSSTDKAKPTAKSHKWVAPTLGTLGFVLVLGIMAGMGFSKAKAVAGATTLGGTIAWLDARALSMEITSLLILAVPVVAGVLPFHEAFSGVSAGSIWLVKSKVV